MLSVNNLLVAGLKWTRNQGISNPGLFQTWKKFWFGQTSYFPRFVTAVWNPGLKPDIFPGLKSRFSTIWNWIWTWKKGRFTNPDLNLEKSQVWTWLSFAVLKLVVSNLEKIQVQPGKTASQVHFKLANVHVVQKW